MKRWTLLGADSKPYRSPSPGTLGGHRRSRVYGKLDCPAALRALARGGYVAQRVFFLDQTIAQAAGYRPCARCLPEAYAHWKAGQNHRRAVPALDACLTRLGGTGSGSVTASAAKPQRM
ncbi:Ada metal-binding domain-containing protein [Pseudomonas boanensis]|uniref:Ada metal-binding domain-containing protein n=1 Tax=Metapseudomonas boanensis TaxID=2822138 RepID=UPI0035D4FA1A